MDKTVALQICLSLVVLYGLANVVRTEMSGKGLWSTLKSTRHHGGVGKMPELTARSDAPTVIYLDMKRIPRQRRNCFKYFTAQDGTWIETCIPEDGTPNSYSEK